MFLFRLALFALRASRFGGGSPDAFLDTFLQDAVPCVGAIISAAHVPERWCPGKFIFLGPVSVRPVSVVCAVLMFVHCTLILALIHSDLLAKVWAIIRKKYLLHLRFFSVKIDTEQDKFCFYAKLCFL